jgi:hypothetical protein
MQNNITLETKRQRSSIARPNHSSKLICRASGRRGPRTRQTFSNRKHSTIVSSHIKLVPGSRLRFGRRHRAGQNNPAFLRKSNQSTIHESTSINMMWLEHYLSRHQSRIGPINGKVKLNRTYQINPVHSFHRYPDQFWQTVGGFASAKYQFTSSEICHKPSTYGVLIIFRGSNYFWSSIQHSNHQHLHTTATLFFNKALEGK